MLELLYAVHFLIAGQTNVQIKWHRLKKELRTFQDRELSMKKLRALPFIASRKWILQGRWCKGFWDRAWTTSKRSLLARMAIGKTLIRATRRCLYHCFHQTVTKIQLQNSKCDRRAKMQWRWMPLLSTLHSRWTQIRDIVLSNKPRRGGKRENQFVFFVFFDTRTRVY